MNTSSASSSLDLESGNGKKSYEKWPEDEPKMLIRLWADNFDRLESREARKVWDQITVNIK